MELVPEMLRRMQGDLREAPGRAEGGHARSKGEGFARCWRRWPTSTTSRPWRFPTPSTALPTTCWPSWCSRVRGAVPVWLSASLGCLRARAPMLRNDFPTRLPSGHRRPAPGLLREASEQFQYVEHMQGNRRLIVEHACKLGLEGIVSKQIDSPYKSGRQETWRKSNASLPVTMLPCSSRALVEASSHYLLAEHPAHAHFGSIACSDFTCRSGQGSSQHLMRTFVLTNHPDAITADRAEPVHVSAVAIRF
jgi:hypothetical protein